MARIAIEVKLSTHEMDQVKQNRNRVVGIPKKHLEEKAKALADKGQWATFIDVLVLLVFGVILFLNVDGLLDLAATDAFLTYHHSKESPVVVVLADVYEAFDRRCEKSSARVVCCTPALNVWLVSHIFRHESRPICPLQGYRMCVENGKANWVGASVNWFPRWKEGGEEVLSSCEGFPSVPLMGMMGCINYNLVLSIRQLGYSMRGAPSEESTTSFIARGFSDPNAKTLQRVRKACNAVQRKDKELRGSSNGIIGSYYKWLKARTQEMNWLLRLKISSKEEVETLEESEEVQALKANLERTQVVKEKFKTKAIKVRKECDELRDVNMATTEALE
ncbi:uncharacterized protein LOC114386062 [Glycine soja]|uniref:uncharacterized protein LOC114386062 n=1 Tax=Glycine soja TaxID=3848 RepID=UPI001038E3E2|nr:uncharacterized protein LOC114386062 [Glycine soja]